MASKYFNHDLYDTTKAEEVAEWDNGYCRGDTRWIHEILMRMPRTHRKWFLDGEGGFRTRYAERAGQDGWYAVGTALVPLTDEQARDWAEERLDADEVDRIFGPCDGDEQSDTLVLDDETLAYIDAIAHADGLTREDVVRRLVRGKHDAINAR